MATTADVTITPTDAVAGTESADLVGSGTAVNATQTFRVKVTDPATFPPPRGGETKIMLIVEELNAGAATIVLEAGDSRTSLQSVKGTDTITLAQADLKYYFLEAGRHLKSDGYIKGLVNTNNCKIRAVVIPAGY